MRELLRPSLLILLALMVPILPFLSFGAAFEQQVARWLDPPPSAGVIAMATVAILSTDILLPVPASLVSTIAASQIGFAAATAASWLGMTLAAVIGFALAKTWGRSLAVRLASTEDLDRMDRLSDRHGTWIITITRAVPVFAEAAVLLMGTTKLAWRRFLPAVMLSNLGIAIVYSMLGLVAKEQDQLPLALAASIALPVLAAALARRYLRE